MSLNLKNFIKLVEQRNPNEPEILQAVTEVVEDLIPYIAREPESIQSTPISLNESSRTRTSHFFPCRLDGRPQ